MFFFRTFAIEVLTPKKPYRFETKSITHFLTTIVDGNFFCCLSTSGLYSHLHAN